MGHLNSYPTFQNYLFLKMNPSDQESGHRNWTMLTKMNLMKHDCSYLVRVSQSYLEVKNLNNAIMLNQNYFYFSVSCVELSLTIRHLVFH